MIASLVLLAVSQSPAPTDFKLDWKPGQQYVYTHFANAVKEGMSGDTTLTVNKADKDGFEVTTTTIKYQNTGNINMHDLEGGTMRITAKGKLSPDNKADGALLLIGMLLPTEPVKPGDSYKLTLNFPSVGNLDMTGKFEGMVSDASTGEANCAHLVASGNMGSSSTKLTFDQLFDTKRGVFVSTAMKLNESTSFVLKLKK